MSAVLEFVTWPLVAPFRWILQWFSHAEKTRAHAVNWIELAEKVWHFRRDQLTEKESAELQGRTAELRQLVRHKADPAKLKLSMESLEAVLRRTGGAIYPKTSLVENVEFFLVAAIVILGIRTYFVQPFKIPTNSMWPTYYGMTAENLPPSVDAPNGLVRVFRFLAFGAQRRQATAPVSGEVYADFFENGAGMAYHLVDGRSWGIFPTQLKEYTFYVENEPTSVRVPLDFSDFDRVVQETFFGDAAGFHAYVAKVAREQRLERSRVYVSDRQGSASVVRLPLGRRVKAGDPVVRFDIMTGDQLFVDRISYHFVQPKVGQGFVFRTGNIPAIVAQYGDQYYIKRLVGVPGDTLEVRSFSLYRNGAPITGAEAFGKNARREDRYPGYRNDGSLVAGETVTVPPDRFFAMGDNSANSWDGRMWGFVPKKDAIGRPLFIYYPFTRRWGPAR